MRDEVSSAPPKRDGRAGPTTIEVEVELKRGSRQLCVTGPDGDEVSRALADAPEGALGELRADRLSPEAVRGGAWRDLPRSTGRDWVFTWRSPGEGGGGGSLPPGIRRHALEAGFRWVDVEAGELVAPDAETAAIPPERRWVSRHLDSAPASSAEAWDIFSAMRAHPAALHKLVVTARALRDNEPVLALVDRLAAEDGRPFSIFAQGAPGHPSRVLGGLAGNSVTFTASREGGETAAGQPGLRRLLAVYRWLDQPEAPPLYGVVGLPALASRSPDLHNAAFRTAGIAGLYLPFECEDVDTAAGWLRGGRVSGLSVTSPHKGRAFDLCDAHDADATGLGAVNTLRMEGGRLVGSNTDRLAARELLAGLGVAPGDAVAVIGAGGAARAVARGARDLDAWVAVFARDADRGREVAASVDGRPGGSLEDLDPHMFRAVVNATPIGVRTPVPRTLAERNWSGTAVLDLAYGGDDSAWRRLVARDGGSYRDGLAFLARQGREQFALWTGFRPDALVFRGGLTA